MEKRITLMIVDGMWHARWPRVGAAEMRRLFGTDTIPTPYTAAVPAKDVQAKIQALNEGYEVGFLAPRLGR